jgi:hypothetical protein
MYNLEIKEDYSKNLRMIAFIYSEKIQVWNFQVKKSQK